MSRIFGTVATNIASCFGDSRSYIDRVRRTNHHNATNPLYHRTSDKMQRQLMFLAQGNPDKISGGIQIFSYTDLKNNDVILYLGGGDKGEIQIIQNNDTGETTIRRSIEGLHKYSLDNYEINLLKNEAILISNPIIDGLLDKKVAIDGGSKYWLKVHENYKNFLTDFGGQIIGELHQSVESDELINYDDYHDCIYAIRNSAKGVEIKVIKSHSGGYATVPDEGEYQFIPKNCNLPLDGGRKGITFVN